jgi:hypothetical protein
MHRTSFVRALLLLLFLVAAPAACVGTEDEVVFNPSTPVAASVDPGLTSDCDTEPLVGRLHGRVYALPLETKMLPDFDTLPAAGTICLDRLAVTERKGYPGFPGVRNRYEWFGVDLQGVFVVDEPGLFYFRLTSDDGSKLVIDGETVVDNDGYHALRVGLGAARLTAGRHTIRVPYWQGPGPLALTLEVSQPGEPYAVFHLDQPLHGSPQ